MCIERRRFSQTMASEWRTAFVVSHKMPCCVLLTAVKNYNKSLEKLQDFLQDRHQDQDFMIQDQDFHFCPRGTSRPRHEIEPIVSMITSLVCHILSLSLSLWLRGKRNFDKLKNISDWKGDRISTVPKSSILLGYLSR